MEKNCNKSSSQKFNGPNYDNALRVAISQYGTKQWDKVASLLDVHSKYSEIRYKTMLKVIMHEHDEEQNGNQSDQASSISPRFSVCKVKKLKRNKRGEGNSERRKVCDGNQQQDRTQGSIRLSRFSVCKVGL